MASSARARLILRILAVVAAVIVLALVALPWLVSLERFRGPIVSAASSALHRKVEVGKLRLEIWSGLGARLDGVVVHNKPGWKSPDLLKAGRVSLKVAFLPLLRGRIEVTRAELEDVELTVERDPAGAFNLGAFSPETPAGRARTARLESLFVSRLDIVMGRLVFVDRKALVPQVFTLKVEDIHGTIRDLSPKTPARFDLQARVLSDGAVRNGRLTGTVAEAELTIADPDLKTLDLMPAVARTLAAAGDIAGFRVPPGLEATKFEALRTHVRVSESRFTTPDLTLSGRDVTVTADGALGFDGSLRCEGTVLLSGDLARSLGEAGRYLVDRNGRLPVPFRLSGDLARPQVSVSEIPSAGRSSVPPFPPGSSASPP